MKQESLQKQQILGLGQGKYKMSLEHLVVLGGKEALLSKVWGVSDSHLKDRIWKEKNSNFSNRRNLADTTLTNSLRLTSPAIYIVIMESLI